MAGGTTSNPVFLQDGQYLTFTVNEASGITLGYTAELDTSTAGQVKLGTDANTVPAGVAVSAQRTSRTATDNIAANGTKLTVCTRGVCYLIATAAAITTGGFVQCGGSGKIKALTVSVSTDVNKIIGRALSTAAGSGDEEIKVLVTVG